MGIRGIRSVLISMLGAAVLLTVGAAPASAVERVPVDFGPPQTFPAGQVCPFQVTLTAIEDDLVQTTLTRNTVLITGPLVLEVTNDETGESVIRDVSGPATITQTGETSITVLLGPSLVILFEGEDATGEVGAPGLFFQPRGVLVLRGFTVIRAVGPTENLCETLA